MAPFVSIRPCVPGGAASLRLCMGALTKTLCETDFVEWADHTAELLRQDKFHEIDLEHLIEEDEG